jgi:hypothetical protein
MESEKIKGPTKEELQEVVKESKKAAEAQREHDYSEAKPYLKAGLAIGAGLLLVWGSQYVFHALAGAIRGFEDLKRSLKE